MLPRKRERYKLSAKLQMSGKIRLPVVVHLESVMDHSSGGEVEALALPRRAEDFVVEEPHIMSTLYVLAAENLSSNLRIRTLPRESDSLTSSKRELDESEVGICKSFSSVFIK